jgi:hypothetical protein
MDMKDFIKSAGLPEKQSADNESFKELEATELYCNTCKKAVTVRKNLLLVLPDGDKYEYRCAFCNETVGSKIDRNLKHNSLIV